VNALLTAAIVVVSVGLSLGVFFVIRRHAPEEGFFVDGDRAAGVFGVLATGFSVLLGFVVFLAFTSYDAARTGARSEATDLVQQYETAQLLPRHVAPKLSGELICYGRSVIGVEWPRLRAGEQPAFNPWGITLFQTLATIHPQTPAEQAAYAKWLDQTSDREQARLDRVQAGNGIVPQPLWLILFVTAALVFLYAFLFADRRERWLPQAVIAATITAMLVTSLLVIRFLDDPYRPGLGSLKPTEMARVLRQIDVANRALGLHVQIPCNSAGRRV
jgi:amino acid transporter